MSNLNQTPINDNDSYITNNPSVDMGLNPSASEKNPEKLSSVNTSTDASSLIEKFALLTTLLTVTSVAVVAFISILSVESALLFYSFKSGNFSYQVRVDITYQTETMEELEMMDFYDWDSGMRIVLEIESADQTTTKSIDLVFDKEDYAPGAVPEDYFTYELEVEPINDTQVILYYTVSGTFFEVSEGDKNTLIIYDNQDKVVDSFDVSA